MPVDRNEDVLQMIERALRRDPDIENAILQERAAEIDSSISELTSRQFNARYPLQVKRKLSRESSHEDGPGTDDLPPTTGLRSKLRTALLSFAKDVVDAKDRGEMIEVVTAVDDYVDRVL